MSEILVNTIKKADGTGSITVPANTGTLVDTSGAAFTGNVTTTGNVGAGTASPAAKLDVHNSSFGGSATTLHLSSTNSASEVIPYAGLGYVVDQGADGIEAGSLTLSTYSSNALTERMRITSDGYININGTYSRPFNINLDTTAPASFRNMQSSVPSNATVIDCRFDNHGSPATGAQYIRFGDINSNNGSITVNGGAVAYNTSSDYRKKENIVDLTDGINRVKQLDVHRFNWIGRDETVDGFLAHEVQTVVPEAVTGTKDEVDDEGNPVYQGIDQSKLVPLLTGALQEAIAKIETLETTVADLQTRVTALENA